MSEQPPGPANEPARRDVRIGHAERETAVNRLQAAFGEGRLDVSEFDQRVAQVYAARTTGELVPLTADLPDVTAPPELTKPARERSAAPAPATRDRDNQSRALIWAWRAWAAAVSVNVVIWVLVSITSGDLQYFWPMWVAGPWGALLLVGTIFGNLGRPSSS